MYLYDDGRPLEQISRLNSTKNTRDPTRERVQAISSTDKVDPASIRFARTELGLAGSGHPRACLQHHEAWEYS